MVWIALLFLLILLLLGIARIPQGERAVVIRLGRPLSRVLGPGTVFVFPLLDRLHRVPVEPFSVSLPPQSAITKDEIPIQLQASLDAKVVNPHLAVGKVRDWRIYLMSQLQDLMKIQLEELDFDRLDEVFPEWVQSIRHQLSEKGREIGVDITGLQISNLSPRQKF